MLLGSVTNTRVAGIEFVQELASLTGTVSCIEGECSGVVIRVTAEDGAQRSTESLNSAWAIADLLPGQYEVAVDYAHWCWRETQHSVQVEGASQAPAFLQSGYIMKVGC